ncbi:MAG: peptidyl-prolyl cis-trans isomerase [Acidobacteriota bacterium]
MRHFGSFLIIFTFIFVLTSVVAAQEAEERVVDEVVAQVNDGVITLSRVNREVKSIVDSEVQQGKKREDVEKQIAEKRGELIANLITEELLIQKAKELGMDGDIEAAVNKRFIELMKSNNLKTLDALYQEMERGGADPKEFREMWRKQATREMVLQKEVQMKIYWGASGKEIKDYFDKHKAQFTKPETVTLSEIFLSFAGRNENTVREKAKQLVAQLRGGADFAKVVADNSDRPNAAETKGKVDTLNIKDLDEKFASAIKGLKAGQYSDPIEVDQVGINILRVDERTAATSESYFDESAVRLAILAEKAPEEQKKFLASLRTDSYIKISENYRPIVSPILFADDRKGKTANK